jgi:hypothetical protein
MRLIAALALACSASACVGIFRPPGGLPPGTPIAEARRSFGGPTGQYALPDGGTRLEFAQGSFGRQTYMLDFDPNGRLVSSQQVLTEANFATIAPGLPRQDLLMRFGRPAWVFGVPRQHIAVWNYRFFTGDCVVFQVSVSTDTGQVTEAAQGWDPACDGQGDRE